MIEKNTVNQVLGILMQHPQFLSEVDKYNLSITDFPTRLEKYVFATISNLYRSGATNIQPIDIYNFLEADPAAKACLDCNKGVEYLQDIMEFSSTENFNYYYNRLKKLNLLKDLRKIGIDTQEFYCENLVEEKAQEINSVFETLTLSDICNKIKSKFLKVESAYARTAEVHVEKASFGIRELLKNMNDSMEIGLPIQGDIINKVFSGAQKTAFTIRSGASGLGKTRAAVMDAAYLAYPIRYNSQKRKWEQKGSNDKVLFVMTEQTEMQIKKMILAYLSDIPEGRFKMGEFTEEEMEILNGAVAIMEKYESNMILVKVPDPSIELVKTLIRENCLLNDIDHVFYDYMFISPALLKEFQGFNLRNDEVLLLFATALKDLAVELNVSFFTSTQVNASADDHKNIRNEASLAGGRSTINKADNGIIMARPTTEELETLQDVIQKWGMPNMVSDVFKCRSGEWTQIRIWSVVDLGRLKRIDLFATDARLNVIPDLMNVQNVIIQNWDSEEDQNIKQFMAQLNVQFLSDEPEEKKGDGELGLSDYC